MKVRDWIKKNIFLDSLILLIVYALISGILHLCRLRFRFFVNQFVVAVVVLGIVVGIIQFIRRQEHKRARIVAYIATSAVIFATAIFISLPTLLFYLGNYENTQYVEGIRYSAHTYEFLDRFVYYYEYKNILISGDILKMEDRYPGCILGEPIRYAYDDDGNSTVISGEGG